MSWKPAEFWSEPPYGGVYLGLKPAPFVTMWRLSWAMLGHVERVCWVMLGHVDGPAPQSVLPQQSQGCILRQSSGHTGQVGYLLLKVPSWRQLWRIWGQCRSCITKNNPKLHFRNTLPLALKAKRNQIKKPPRNTQTPTPMAVKAKRNQDSSKNPPSKRSPQPQRFARQPK